MAQVATQIESTRERLRAEMPVARRWAYFDHAAVAPVSEPAAKVLRRWLAEAVEEGDTNWLDWARQLNETREIAARLVGAQTDEIALLLNTTAGINLVAEGIDWRDGDNIVTLDDEFPSNLYPWLHLASRGVETRRVPTDEGRVDLERLAERCDSRTRVVSVSWVGYGNGCRRDLRAIAELAHRHDTLFFVDAIQCLGVFPIDVVDDKIDCLAADGHKWMLSPEGAAIAYVSREWLPRLRPIGVGWNSVVHAGDYSRVELELKSNAARYEGGSYNMAGFLALGASLAMLMSAKIENVAAAVLEVTDRACERLQELGAVVRSPRSAAESSGIVSFELPGVDPIEARRVCLEHKVALACRAGRLRISPHAYNNEDDLQQLIEALQSTIR